MEIISGKTAGFCYGVKRAVDGSLEQIKNNNGKSVYCLGELVHNKQVILELESQGIKFIENIKEVNKENLEVIIRAHGIEKSIYKNAKDDGIEIIDYTCPNVLKIHKIAERYEKDGYYIFLTGTENHPEINGTISYCGKNFSLIRNEEDIENALEKLKEANIKKLLLISQTTYSMKKFKDIENKITKLIDEETELLVKNTICLATELRQKETTELSKKVNMMIIIGGKNSSNTKKLYEIAKENCNNTICIETKDEINKDSVINQEKIGIMAGASTPQKSIEEVINYIKQN